MNKTLSTTLIVLATLVLAGAIFFAGAMYARSNLFSGLNNYAYGFGMLGRSGMMTGQRGMMGGNGMMNGYNYNNTSATPLTVDQARDAAEKYIQSLDVNGLETGEVMIFDNHAYVIVDETETGLGAFELLVDPASQVAYPEHGPNMMWNIKYGGLNHSNMMNGNGMMRGMMYGMMGGNGWVNTIPADASAVMTVTPEQAVEYAQTYLDANLSGAVPSDHATPFYGYYTLDFEKDGRVAGMLSVNGYSGQVFLHTWHGRFIEEAE